MYIIEMHAKVESDKDKFNLEDIINICFATGIKKIERRLMNKFQLRLFATDRHIFVSPTFIRVRKRSKFILISGGMEQNLIF